MKGTIMEPDIEKDVPPTKVATTSSMELRRQIMSPSVPKNEREQWAALHIKELEDLLRGIAVRACSPLKDICDVELEQVLLNTGEEPQGNKGLYEVVFVDGWSIGEWANNAEQARILAQARRIRRNDPEYRVKEWNYLRSTIPPLNAHQESNL